MTVYVKLTSTSRSLRWIQRARARPHVNAQARTRTQNRRSLALPQLDCGKKESPPRGGASHKQLLPAELTQIAEQVFPALPAPETRPTQRALKPMAHRVEPTRGHPKPVQPAPPAPPAPQAEHTPPRAPHQSSDRRAPNTPPDRSGTSPGPPEAKP